jgi:hypothetical protein
VCLFVCLFIYSFIRLFVYSFIRLFVYSFIRLFVYSFIRLFVYSFIHLFVYSSIHLFVHCSFIHSFVHLSICPSFILLLDPSKWDIGDVVTWANTTFKDFPLLAQRLAAEEFNGNALLALTYGMLYQKILHIEFDDNHALENLIDQNGLFKFKGGPAKNIEKAIKDIQTGIFFTSHHITSHHITSHHITSHHITSHHITSHHMSSLYIASLQLKLGNLYSFFPPDLARRSGEGICSSNIP